MTSEHREKESSLYTGIFVLLAVLAISSAVIYIVVSISRYKDFFNLGVYWGADFTLYYMAIKSFFKTGSLYTENYWFINSPLAAMVLFPYLLFEPPTATALKFIESLLLVSLNVYLLFRMVRKRALVFHVLLFATLGSQILIQLFELNIYIEVVTLLMLALYFNERGKKGLSAFSLAFAIMIKVFLLPLCLVPLIARDRRYFLFLVSYSLLLFLMTIPIFSLPSYNELYGAISNNYPRIIEELSGQIYFSSQFVGYHYLFDKVLLNDLNEGALTFFKAASFFAFAVISLHIAYCMGIFRKKMAEPDLRRIFFLFVLTVLFLSCFYSFKGYFSVLFLPLIPLIAGGANEKLNNVLCIGYLLVLIDPHALIWFFERYSPGFMNVYEFFSFQLVGLNILFMGLYVSWLRRIKKQPSVAQEGRTDTVP